MDGFICKGLEIRDDCIERVESSDGYSQEGQKEPRLFRLLLMLRAYFVGVGYDLSRVCEGVRKMRYFKAIFLVLVTLPFSGCHVFRSFEQWKCNRFGMCHFSTSAPAYAAPPPIYSAAPYTGSTSAPPYASGIELHDPMPSGSTGCASCQK